ncbi:PH domain-containing protein [Eggerthellaceae bacterium DNF00809]
MNRAYTPLCPRIKYVWMLGNAIGVTLFMVIVCAVIQGALVYAAPELSLLAFETSSFTPGFIVLVCSCVLWLILLAAALLLPFLQYKVSGYAIEEHYIFIRRGIIWRHTIVIPLVRVQNIDTEQGPLLSLFKMLDLSVFTAAEQQRIPGIEQEYIDTLRDKIAHLTRLAKEDV